MTKHITTILLLLLCSLTSTVQALSLTSSVDRSMLGLNETLVLTVTLDKQGSDSIDFKEVGLQFDILNQQRSSQTSIVNGRVSTKTQWTLILAPKETGNLVIPSFSTEGVFSDAIRIKVTDHNPSGAPNSSNPAVFLVANVNKSRVYVQEQILLTLELYYRIPLSGYTPQDIKITNTIVETVSENTIKRQHNGQYYNVLQKTYALHPQSSGTLRLPAQTWQVEKASRGFGFGQITSPYLRVRSLPLTINIDAIPTHSTATDWLPTPQLTLQQKWQQSIITAQVGEPLTYTLTMEAQGLNHSQLPTIDIKSDKNFTIYRDTASTENTKNELGITGKRTENYAVIPNIAGTIIFPKITLRWWNTNKDQEETLTLPSQTVIVANSGITDAGPGIPFQETSKITNNIPLPTTNKHIRFWQATTVIALLLALTFFLLWQRNLHRHTTLESNEQAPRPCTNTTSVYPYIEASINQQDWRSLKQHLLTWTSLKVARPIKNSQEVCRYFPALGPVLTRLDRTLYGQQPDRLSLKAKDCLALLKQQKIKKNGANTSTDPLAPLYPS